MADPMNTPLTGDIFDLSIDDLVARLPEMVRLGGPGPFVINLCTSNAPIGAPATGIAGSHHAYVYQVQRTEDKRLRYRLRLGPFADEDEANAILERARDIYPGALTATADAEDLRAIAKMQAKAGAPKSAAAPAPSASAPIAPAPSAAVPNAPAPIAPAPSAPASIAPVPVAAAPAVPAPSPGPAGPGPRPIDEAADAPAVRALTQPDPAEDPASRWFAIELSRAEDAFDPDTLPNLDIFSVYRLYSVAQIDRGRIVHALRLGFFGEETAAAAVASYLADFYEKPAIKRVSVAEHRRFTDQRLEPRKDVGETGKQAVIEITNERFVREKRGTGPAP
jgi:hypothetical protein